MILVSSVDFDRISRIEIYKNSGGKLPVVKAATHATHIIPSTLFSWTTNKPVCHCKINGKVICKPDYQEWGYAWDDGETPVFCMLPCEKENYVTCIPLIINGNKRGNLQYNPDVGGKRPRPVMGMKNGQLKFYVTTDGRTPEELRDILFRSGWENAVLFDGGGSNMCFFPEGEIYSSRVIPYFICIWTIPQGVDKIQKMNKGFGEVYAFSLKKHGNIYLSKNFRVKEFKCSDGTDTIFIDPKLMNILQDIREWAKKPVNINSGYRTEERNIDVGGALYSRHKYGCAADITVNGKTPKQVYDYLNKKYPNCCGIGLYSSFVHIDSREEKSRWNG